MSEKSRGAWVLLPLWSAAIGCLLFAVLIPSWAEVLLILFGVLGIAGMLQTEVLKRR